jgi:hypothetical protein
MIFAPPARNPSSQAGLPVPNYAEGIPLGDSGTRYLFFKKAKYFKQKVDIQFNG